MALGLLIVFVILAESALAAKAEADEDVPLEAPAPAADVGAALLTAARIAWWFADVAAVALSAREAATAGGSALVPRLLWRKRPRSRCMWALRRLGLTIDRSLEMVGGGGGAVPSAVAAKGAKSILLNTSLGHDLLWF